MYNTWNNKQLIFTVSYGTLFERFQVPFHLFRIFPEIQSLEAKQSEIKYDKQFWISKINNQQQFWAYFIKCFLDEFILEILLNVCCKISKIRLLTVIIVVNKKTYTYQHKKAFLVNLLSKMSHSASSNKSLCSLSSSESFCNCWINSLVSKN